MRLPACLLLVLLLVGSSSAGLLQNVAGALECPQNLVVVNKINDKAFMQQQIRCILGETDEECNEVGKKAKYIGPMVLSNHCPKPICDACTKRAVRMVVAKMQNEYKQDWHRIQLKLRQHRG